MNVLLQRRRFGFRFSETQRTASAKTQLTTHGQDDVPETKRACLFKKLKIYNKKRNETMSATRSRATMIRVEPGRCMCARGHNPFEV